MRLVGQVNQVKPESQAPGQKPVFLGRISVDNELFDMSRDNMEYYQLVCRDGNRVLVVSNVEAGLGELEKALVFDAEDEETADDIVYSLKKLAEAGRWFFVYDYKWLEWFIYCVYDVRAYQAYVERE